MGGQERGGRLAELRKRVQKASAHELSTGPLLDEALDVICGNFSEDLIMDVLALLLVLARKLRAALPDCSAGTHDLVHRMLGTALLPTGSTSALLLRSLEASDRPRQARAADCLSALARMSDELFPPSIATSSYNGLLTPLFRKICEGEIASKRDLNIINTLLPCVPPQGVPVDLLPRLRSQMGKADAAGLRGSILCFLFINQYSLMEGGEETKIKTVVQTLVPLIASGDTATLTNVSRYVFPRLFEAIPGLPLSLLREMEPGHSRSDISRGSIEEPPGGESFPAWIAIASLCVASNQLALSDLPSHTLLLAMEHADPTVRIDTLRLLISSRELLQPSTIRLVERSMLLCSTLSDSYARSEFTAAVVSLFKTLKAVFVLPKSSKGEADAVNAIIDWILEKFIDPGLAAALHYPVFKVVMALNVFSTYLAEFGADIEVVRRIFTRSRVEALLACQACNFAEVRSKARTVLALAKNPLPRYESLNTVPAKALLASALESINHPRKTQAEAGRAVLCILFETLSKQPISDSLCICFVENLVNDLETRLCVAESDLVQGITQAPLHGTLSAVSGVINCINLSKDSQQLWNPLFDRLISLVDRIWVVTSRVVSLSSESSEHSGHEIARAYEVMAGDGGENEAMDHTNLLSGCWRATTEAADLLASIASAPLTQLGQCQTIWSFDEIDGFGKRYLAWLHEIRHRGTFSKVTLSFGRVILAVQAVEIFRPLCRQWLDFELDAITTEEFSTTRRSAALPYSVLALVVGDWQLLETAVERLVVVARIGNEASDDVTRVHAFNVLRIILLDTRTSRHLSRFLEKVVLVALEAFSSANWNVRNVGLILFSSLIHRSLGSSDGTQDYFQSRQHLSKRQALQSWHAKYPSIVPFLRKELHAAAQSTTKGSQGSLFPILIILRSLRWSLNDGGLAEAIMSDVAPFLVHQTWQVREVAAQALSSLCAPEMAGPILAQCASSFLQLDSNNARHGYLRYWKHLVTDVILLDKLSKELRLRIEQSAEMLLSGINARLTPALITTATLDLAACIQFHVQDSHSQNGILGVARSCMEGLAAGPGADILVDTAARILAQSHAGRMFLLHQRRRDARLVAIEQMGSEGPFDASNATILTSLVDLITTTDDPIILVAAMNAVTRFIDAGSSTSSLSERILISFCDHTRHLVEHCKNVPLREACLPALSWGLDRLLRLYPTPQGEMTDKLSLAVEIASAESQSKPCRLSAVRAIEHLQKLLYPSGGEEPQISPRPLLAFHRIIIRLLQDDSQSIRDLARGLVCHGLGLTPTCLARVIEFEWQWLGGAIRDGRVDQADALSFVWELCLDTAGFEQDIAALRPTSRSTDILFDVEPPNQFRDPLVDSENATGLMGLIDPSSLNTDSQRLWRASCERLQTLHHQSDRVLDLLGSDLSPISRPFEARRNVRRRTAIHSRIWMKGDGLKPAHRKMGPF